MSDYGTCWLEHAGIICLRIAFGEIFDFGLVLVFFEERSVDYQGKEVGKKLECQSFIFPRAPTTS